MPRTAPFRPKSVEELSDETEFARRVSIAECTPRYFAGPRYMTTELVRRGIQLGSRTETLSRGKVVSVTYVLPPITGA